MLHRTSQKKCLHSSELTPGYHLPNPCSLLATSTQKVQVTCPDSNSKSWPENMKGGIILGKEPPWPWLLCVGVCLSSSTLSLALQGFCLLLEDQA